MRPSWLGVLCIQGQKATSEFVGRTLCGGLLGGASSSSQQGFVCLVSSNT
jgi:hypothetical protein